MEARRFPGASLIYTLTLALSLAACGEVPVAGDPDGGVKNDGGSGNVQVTRVLSIVGRAIVKVKTGRTVQLSVVLAQRDVGPVAGEPIEFIIESSGAVDSTLGGDGTTPGGDGSVSIDTDANGVATVTLTAGAPTQFQVVASADRVTPVGFQVLVEPRERYIEIVNTGIMTIDATRLRASFTAATQNQFGLKVRLYDDERNPITGENITFEFATANPPASVDPVGITDSTGVATSTFQTGTTTGLVVVMAAATGAPHPAEFDIRIQASPAGGGCTTSAQCGAGYLCSGGQCTPWVGGGNCGDHSCPFGYTCNPGSGQCTPAFGGGCTTNDQCSGGVCNNGTCEPEDPQCDASVPCPSGTPCVNGICQPGTDVPDVTGLWFTKHWFNLRDALPSILRSLADPIRRIDQVLLGSSSLPSWVNAILQPLISQYVPEWVISLVHILDSLLTIMSNLRSEGEMELGAVGGNLALLDGDEAWTSFVFYYLPLCGNNIPSDPTPDCARMDIFVDNQLETEIGLEVYPFTAKVTGSAPSYSLLVDRRKVKIELHKLILLIVNMLVSSFTPYNTLHEALPAMADCESIGLTVEELIGINIEPLCIAGLTAAGLAIEQRLANVSVGSNLLEFEGPAGIRTYQLDPDVAEWLGKSDYESSRDGKWDACFACGTPASLRHVDGAWHGSREPFFE
jgi:hypothetical protein